MSDKKISEWWRMGAKEETEWSEITSRKDIPLLLNNLNLLGEGVEVGVWRGNYSRIILDKWNGKKLWLIDCWEQQDFTIYQDALNANHTNQYLNVCLTLEKFQHSWDRVGLLKLFSEQAVKLFEDESLDFVYIDANHHTGVQKDLEIWYPKVKPGGIFAGHDYIDGVGPGNNPVLVKSVVDNFFSDKEHIFILADEDPSWLVVKNKHF